MCKSEKKSYLYVSHKHNLVLNTKYLGTREASHLEIRKSQERSANPDRLPDIRLGRVSRRGLPW